MPQQQSGMDSPEPYPEQQTMPPMGGQMSSPMGGGIIPYGTPRNPLMVFIFMILTLGIYGLYWQYQIAEDNKNVSGVGPGGLMHILLMFIPFINIYRMVMLTAETGDMQMLNGVPKTVSGSTFFWIFLPFVGGLVWLWKLQGAVNNMWYAKGAPRI